MYRIICLFILLQYVVYSENLIVSNGTLKLNYSTEKNKITDISNMLNGKKYIDYIDEAIYINEKLSYPVKTEISYVENTGVVNISNVYENGVQTEKYVYITDRRNLIYIDNSVKNPNQEDFYILYRIKPKEDMGMLEIQGKNYKYNDFYFSFTNEKGIYFADENDLRNLSFYPLGKNRIKASEKDIILFLNPKQKGKLIISPLKIDEDYFEHSVIDEVTAWQKWLKPTEDELVNRNLLMLKMLQNKDGSIISFDREIVKLKSEDMLYTIEAFIEWEYYDDAKRIMTYLLTTKKENPSTNYLISNYEYNSDKQEIKKIDRYGEVKSFYNSALFLYLFSKYIEKTDDKDFFRVNKQEIESGIYYFLLAKLKNGKTEKESGRRESGLYSTNIETYAIIYKSLSEYLKIIEKTEKEIDFSNDRKKLNELKEVFKKNFIVNEKLISTLETPQVSELNRTYYFDEEIINSKDNYALYIRNLIREYWNNKNLELIDEIEFSKKLIEINYRNTLRKTVAVLEEKIKNNNGLLLNKYNEIDVEATSRYLVLKSYLEEK